MGNKRGNEKSRFMRLERKITEEISHFLFALGNQFVNVKNAEGAFDCFKYSLDLNPKHQPSCYNLGALYNVTGNLDGAYRMFVEAMRMRPEDFVARTALGEVARKLGKVEESRKILEAVNREDPESYVAMSAMAILEYDCGHLAEAMDWNERALKKQPNDLHMLLNQALINMTYGHWSSWWHQYEYCLSYQKNEKMRGLRMSDAWSGQEMEGKTLLVVSDQGSGDAIQFSRYLGEAREKGKFGKLVYLVQADLKELLGRVDGVDEVAGFGEKMRIDYDAFSSLLGIMRVLRIDPENCHRPPHVRTNPTLDALWEHRVGRLWDGRSKKIGVTWAGDPRHGNDHARSIPLPKLVSLIHAPGTQLFSFQVGPGSNQLASDPTGDFSSVIDLGSDFRQFDDTASALRQMDLLVSCDTSVPHLAACLGIPTWWLISNPPEWRVLTDCGTHPWYREARLFRQGVPRNWDNVIEAVMQELYEWVKYA